MSKEKAKEFMTELESERDFIKKQLVRKGLDKDKVLVEKIKKVSTNIDEAVEHIKKSVE